MSREVFLRELRMNPEFAALCREIQQRKRPQRWKAGKTVEEWAHATGYGEGIDFVLKTLGYDNDGTDDHG